MDYRYRSSKFKREAEQVVILSAAFNLSESTPAQVKAYVEELNAKRRGSQPAGASTGSTFKNPEGDFAGRLIEAAGLKGNEGWWSTGQPGSRKFLRERRHRHRERLLPVDPTGSEDRKTTIFSRSRTGN